MTISKVIENRMSYIERTNSEIYNKVLKGVMTVNQGYLDLKKSNKTV